MDKTNEQHGVARNVEAPVQENTRIQERLGSGASKPVTRQFIHSLRGKYKGSGLMDELLAEKRRESEL